jgi:hypothetical protein
VLQKRATEGLDEIRAFTCQPNGKTGR